MMNYNDCPGADDKIFCWYDITEKKHPAPKWLQEEEKELLFVYSHHKHLLEEH